MKKIIVIGSFLSKTRGSKGLYEKFHHEIQQSDLKLELISTQENKFLRILEIIYALLFYKYDKIIITRPTVSKEEIGFLPGSLSEKLDPWIQPIYQNMYLLYNRDKVDKHIKENDIEIVPISFLRGRTFLDSIVIVDEAQNATHEQMEMIISRIGFRSKMIICGDEKQIDLKFKEDSGFQFLYKSASKIKNMYSTTLKTNNRDPIVEDLLLLYEEANAKRSK